MVLAVVEVELLLRSFYDMLQYYHWENEPLKEDIEGLTKLADILVEADPKYKYLYRDIALLTVPDNICI